MSVAISLDDVSKSFKMENCSAIHVLENITFSINYGEITAITGRSGSGKSTLLHVMSGLEKPTKGVVMVDGIDISKLNSKDIALFRNKKVGFVFQSFFLEPGLNAWENVSLPLIVRNINRRERKRMALDALERVTLANRVNHRPSQLSGREIQRVCIARAIVGNPDIIFADEPTGNLDKENGENVIKILKEFACEGLAVVLVTHNLEDASQCDRIIELSDGIIIN